MHDTSNLNVISIKELFSPSKIKEDLPIDEVIANTVTDGRNAITDIIHKRDSRFLMIVGPCSIHDTEAILDYANKFAKLREEVKEQIELVMRVYFEKPRTTVGWKGLITDPHLNGNEDVTEGLYCARKTLIDINSLGIPCATEFLDPIVPQYICDLISWVAIGARTSESQIHRIISSGLSMPVGFKNNTEGNIKVAIDALNTSDKSNSFIGISENGKPAVVKTKGNLNCHVILRGGRSGQNFSSKDIKETLTLLSQKNLNNSIMIDCSHGNSNKEYKKQIEVFYNVLTQRMNGNKNIIGTMLESNLYEGSQKLSPQVESLQYGISITDGCIDWPTTESLILDTTNKLEQL